MDGDRQHDPEDIPRLVERVLADEADVVIGVRWGKTSGMPAYRRVGKRVLDYATAVGTRNGKLTDSQSGYRVFSNTAVRSIEPTEDGLSVESQVLIEAQERQLRIDEVNVDFDYEVDGSTVSPGRHGFGVLGRVITLVSERRPLLFFGVAGAVLLAVAGVLGLTVVRIFFETRDLAVGYSFIVVLLGVPGALSVFIGIVLNVIQKITKA